MISKSLTSSLCLAGIFSVQLLAQTYDTNNNVVQIVAGSGTAGLLNGQGTQAMFSRPLGVVVNSSSNLFVLDADNRLIRKITPDGSTTTFVGGGTGSIPGYGTSVTIPSSSLGPMVIDRADVISIIAFGEGILRIYPDGLTEFLSFEAISSGSGLAVDSENNLYFSSLTRNSVYRLSASGTLTLLAGNGSVGSTDGKGIFASFKTPRALAVDAAKNVYVWDSGNYVIRRIDENQNVTTIAGDGTATNADGQGTAARFNTINSMTVDPMGNVIMACGSSIRKMSPTTNVTTIAGSFSQSSYANGVGALARFNGANGLWLSQGKILVADSGNHRIRQITSDPQPALVADSNLGIRSYSGVTITGLVGRTYRIQSSPDMENWTTQATLLLSASPHLWFDLNPIAGNRFYRAVLLP